MFENYSRCVMCIYVYRIHFIYRRMVEPFECLNSVSNPIILISYYDFLIKKNLIKILANDQLIIAGIIGKCTLCTSSTPIKCIRNYENIDANNVL